MTELRVRFTLHFWTSTERPSQKAVRLFLISSHSSRLEEQLHWGLMATLSSFQQLGLQLEPELHLLN